MMAPSGVPLLEARLTLSDVNQIPTNRLQVEMLVAIYFTAALAYFTYGLRMYSRFSSKQIGLEDWLMTAATIFSVGFMAAQYLYLRYNYAGFPENDLPYGANIVAAGLTMWLTQLLYSPILGLVKSSTLVFLLRIAGHIRNIKLCIHVVNIINVCLTVASVIAWIFGSTPVAAYWDPALQMNGHYVDLGALMLSTSLLTILTDFLVLAIPFWAFMRTQLPLATRLGVVMIFMAGGLVTAFGIVRFCVLAQQYWEPSSVSYMYTWGPVYPAIEANLAIITGCLPVLRPLLRKWFPKQFGNSSTEETGYAGQRRSDYGGGRNGNDVSIRMQDFSHELGNVRCGSNSATESHEQLFNPAGIKRTTDIHVSYSTPISTPITLNFDENGRKDTPRPSDPALVV